MHKRMVSWDEAVDMYELCRKVGDFNGNIYYIIDFASIYRRVCLYILFGVKVFKNYSWHNTDQEVYQTVSDPNTIEGT